MDIIPPGTGAVKKGMPRSCGALRFVLRKSDERSPFGTRLLRGRFRKSGSCRKTRIYRLTAWGKYGTILLKSINGGFVT